MSKPGSKLPDEVETCMQHIFIQFVYNNMAKFNCKYPFNIFLLLEKISEMVVPAPEREVVVEMAPLEVVTGVLINQF